MDPLRFRQIHLDFHTSPAIDGIGASFDKAHWQKVLLESRVDSVTTFALCHHGWSYYETKVGRKHPHMKGDLLRAQFEASKEIDVNVPIYLTAGVHNVMAEEHPEWRVVNPDGQYGGWTRSPVKAGFKTMCFNSPYMDHLCEQFSEVVRLFPDGDGIFLDIIGRNHCVCQSCLKSFKQKGLDPNNEKDLQAHADLVLQKYYQRATEAVRSVDPDMPVFHNSGHVTVGRQDILPYFSHLELESLPTGGWGYDHFPVSAKYVQNLNMEVLGMTGKFHTTWGEFGGIKHPNALRYECAAMLAYNAKCSVGDQLHPCGKLDDSTYHVIGSAYKEVEQKEAWCKGAKSVASLAVLWDETLDVVKTSGSDGLTGVCRMLLEGQIPFDVVDTKMEFSDYQVLLLPDVIEVSGKLLEKCLQFQKKGGKLIMSGRSGFHEGRDDHAFGLPVEWGEMSAYCPDYILPAQEYREEGMSTPFVMYMPSRRMKVKGGKDLGAVVDPYFNREWDHFCSHQHTPFKMEPSGYSMGVMTDSILYFAHPVFSIYRGYGTVILKNTVMNMIRSFLGEDLQFKSNLPSTARMSLNRQANEKRTILHLLYANTISRGGAMNLSGGTVAGKGLTIEVIEELLPLHEIALSVKAASKPSQVRLEPQGQVIDFVYANGYVDIKLDRMVCHQMIVMLD